MSESLTCKMPDLDSTAQLEEWLRKRMVEPCSIRASKCNVCDTCPRKFFWLHRVGVIPQGFRTQDWTGASMLGTFFHKYMELKLTSGTPDSCYDGYLEEQIRKVKGKAGDLSELEEEMGLLDDVEKSVARMASKARVLATIYLRKSVLRRVDFRGEAAEVEWRVPVTFRYQNQTLDVEGRLDLLGSFGNGKTRSVVDYKTTGQSAFELANTYPLGHAFALYPFLAADYLSRSGADIACTLDSFIIGILQVPGIKFCPATKDKAVDGQVATAYSNYLDRCEAWYRDHDTEAIQEYSIGFPTRDILSTEYIRSLFERFVPFMVPEYSWPNIPTLLSLFPKYPVSCRSVYSVCPYVELCKAPHQYLPLLLTKGYKQCFTETELSKPINDLQQIYGKLGLTLKESN